MGIGKKDIIRIADLAHSEYMEIPKYATWDGVRDQIDGREVRALAYLKAINVALQLNLDIEYYVKDGKAYVRG